jgi:tetratricopeptide (TPR) repeat protein
MMDRYGWVGYNPSMSALSELTSWLNEVLEPRHIQDGFRILEQNASELDRLDPQEATAAHAVLCIAEWVDAGYSDQRLIDALLQKFSTQHRRSMPIGEYLLLRMAEAFSCIAREDADSAISLLHFVLQAERELNDPRLMVLAHFWKGRAHRKKGEYDAALHDIAEARRLANRLHTSSLTALIHIQEGWINFQLGRPKEGLRLLDQAEAALKGTDDWLALGNIESARGRIVRRSGEYAQALYHFDKAVAIYARRYPNHRNLARALVNAAYVKRLIALQLRKRIDARAAGPTRGAEEMESRGAAHSRYIKLCREALDQLHHAGEIYAHHQNHIGTGTVLVNAGQLHLDQGEIERAAQEAVKAYELAQQKHDHILMARARLLQSAAENARVEEQLEDADLAVHANLARQYSEEAIALAKHTENRRLTAGAYLARGNCAANDFFQDWDEAKQYVELAASLIGVEDRDHLWEEMAMLKSRILRASKIDDTLRAWSEGMLGEKTFQQVTEEFAEIVIPKVWMREGRKVSRVAQRLSVSPKKVRRILRNAGLLAAGE